MTETLDEQAIEQPLVDSPALTINGDLVRSAESIRVVNPATGEPFVEVPSASNFQLDTAVAAARSAAPGWAAVPIEQRQQLVRELVSVIRDNVNELALLVTLEQGKPLAKAAGEIESGLRYCEAYAEMALPTETVRDDATELVQVRRAPVGVVGAITAWNYPLLLALWKIGPALVAGNPVLVKPSPYTPVATLRVGELAQQVLPPGILQVLAGGDELGRGFTSHPGIDKISFTGSLGTGRAIMASAAGTLKRLTLELGGNDAGIVLDDADPASISEDLYWGGLSNCGQVCAGLKRLYVPAALADAYQEALAEVAAKVVVGNGLTPGVDMGPIQNAAQHARVTGLIDQSVTAGARVTYTGEAPDGPGSFHPVTLIRCDSDDLPIVAQEQFGPVLPILTYTDLDEVISRANASEFGLGGSVWSPDEARATAVADRLEAGTVWVNAHPNLSPNVPFGGLKQSGIGVESSQHGLEAYTNLTVLRVKR